MAILQTRKLKIRKGNHFSRAIIKYQSIGNLENDDEFSKIQINVHQNFEKILRCDVQ